MSSPRYVTPLQHLWSDPLSIFMLVSVVFFIPVILTDAHYDKLDGSIFESGANSIENTISLSCTISLSVPLLVDILLDIIQPAKAEFLGYRLMSILSMMFSAIVSISYQRTRHGVTMALVSYAWGYFVELSIVLSFLKYLMPSIFTNLRISVLGFLQFIFFFGISINSISAVYYLIPLTLIIYIVFYTYLGIFAILISIWFHDMYQDYRISKSTFILWIQSLSFNDYCCISFVLCICSFAVVILLLNQYLDPHFTQMGYVNQTDRYIIEGTRVFISFFTYILPSRILRDKLLEAKKNLEVKTELVKYFSHEIRSPVSVIDIGEDKISANFHYLLRSRTELDPIGVESSAVLRAR